jgi:hypothetical protein
VRLRILIYSVAGVRWRSTTAAAIAGRGALVAVASSRASREEDVVFDLILAKG